MEFNFDLVSIYQMHILILTGFLHFEVLSFVLQLRAINEDFWQKNIFFLDWSIFALPSVFFFKYIIIQDAIFAVRQNPVKKNIVPVFTPSFSKFLQIAQKTLVLTDIHIASVKLATELCGIKSKVKFCKTIWIYLFIIIKYVH